MDDLKMKPAFFKTTVRSELHHLISYGFLSRCCKQRRTKKNNTKSVVCPAGCLFAGLNLACTRICPNPSSLHLQLFGKLTLTDASDSSPRANGTEFHFGFPPTNTAECIWNDWTGTELKLIPGTQKTHWLNQAEWFLPCGEAGLILFDSLLQRHDQRRKKRFVCAL